MDKKIMGAIAAFGAAATPLASAQAAVSPAEVRQALHADSFADLLRPVPNAKAILHAINESHGAKSTKDVQVAQVFFDWRRRDYHHHHHHHHQRYYRYYDHHHHHHRQRFYRYEE